MGNSAWWRRKIFMFDKEDISLSFSCSSTSHLQKDIYTNH